MKKFLFTFIMLALALTALAGGASATDVNDLTALAQYAPEGTLAFIAFRADDDFIDTLDQWVIKIGEAVEDEPAPPDFSIRQSLAELVFDGYDNRDVEQSFDTLRLWLGDSVAVIIPSVETLDAPLPFVIGAQITDRAAAETFIAQGIEDEGEYTTTETETATIYESSTLFNPSFIITDDAIFLGSFENGLSRLVAPNADSVRLNITDDFNDTLAALPESDYSAVAYIDPADAIDVILDSASFELGQLENQLGMDLNLDNLSDAVGKWAVGLTILQDRVLTMDIAQRGEMMMAMEYAPINLGLLDLAPADTAFLISGNGIGSSIQMALDSLNHLDALLKEQGVLPIPDAGPFSNLGPDDLATFLTLSFEGSTGLDLQETLAWMNGDFAVYSGLSVSEGGLLGVAPQAGVALSTDNPSATAGLVSAIARMALESFSAATFEDGTLTVPLGALFSMPELGSLSMTSTDDYFLAGTTDAVNFALSGDGASLSEADAFAFDQSLFLPDTMALAYVNFAPLRGALASFAQANPTAINRRDLEMSQAMLGLIDSMSITASVGDETAAARFTITLGE